ncbi:hypothetical protein Tco_0876370 [Tanacetum coccineum]|uniref:Uncharacterized protein n=1 Tax=Tanacetum coccineum TaxID=301880 RepID=A0ABQ5BXS4_9ASTR
MVAAPLLLRLPQVLFVKKKGGSFPDVALITGKSELILRLKETVIRSQDIDDYLFMPPRWSSVTRKASNVHGKASEDNIGFAERRGSCMLSSPKVNFGFLRKRMISSHTCDASEEGFGRCVDAEKEK